MDPMTRSEIFMAAAAGEYDGDPPTPVTRREQWLKKMVDRIEQCGSSVSPEGIDAAIADYLNTHDADIVTEQELSDALAGYYNKNVIDTALNEKQDTLTAGDNISIETVNGELTISATDTNTTYSAGTGLSLSGTTFSNSAPNVKSDWNAAAGTDAEILNKPTIPTVMAGASANAAGAAGLVPAPAAGDNEKYLRGDGAWASFNVLSDLSVFSPNSFFRGKDLGIVNSSNMDAFITNHGIPTGEFTDIYVGDYFTAPYNGTATIFRIAGFNLYMWSGDAGLTTNHIVVVPDYQLTTGAMNSTDTTAGSYKGSDMFTNIIGGSAVTSGVNKNLYTTFGDHLLKYKELLSNTMSTDGKSKAIPTASGVASNWAWTDVYANLMSGSHLWGEASGASSLYDYGIPVGQFPLFRYEPKYIINRSTSGSRNWYWLRNITISAGFARCADDGSSSHSRAGGTGGVRPLFLLG